MDSKEKDLCQYRISSALETLETAKWCVSNRHYKDAINRCYYAAFYAAKAVLALENAIRMSSPISINIILQQENFRKRLVKSWLIYRENGKTAIMMIFLLLP